MKKIAIISPVLPPSRSGQALVLYHLLNGVEPSKYCLISNQDYNHEIQEKLCSQKLPVKYYYIPPIFQLRKRLSVGKSFFLLLDHIGYAKPLENYIIQRAHHIANILVKEKCEAIVACTADLFDPVAAFYASKMLNIPYYLYAFDHYSYQTTHYQDKRYAQKIEKEIINGAKGVIVPNEYLEKEYNKQYGVKPFVIHNPFKISEYKPIESNHHQERNQKTILYTGAIYDAHYDAIQNLTTALKMIELPEVYLHLYTSQHQIVLKIKGISGPVVFHKPCHHTEIPSIQQQADILFLPLAFSSPYPGIIKTASPGKMGEYLASGKPILVHAPKNSFISWYFKKYECGCVVDEKNPDLLAKEIKRLLEDKKYVETLCDNARYRAEVDFNITTARLKFCSLFQNNPTENQ